MSTQLPEFIEFSDDDWRLITAPTVVEDHSDLPANAHPDPGYVGNTACERGYVASWRFASGHLLLTGIAGRFVLRNGAPIVATWFTGQLVAGTGQILEQLRPGVPTLFERQLVANIEAGKVRELCVHTPSDDVGRQTYDAISEVLRGAERIRDPSWAAYYARCKRAIGFLLIDLTQPAHVDGRIYSLVPKRSGRRHDVVVESFPFPICPSDALTVGRRNSDLTFHDLFIADNQLVIQVDGAGLIKLLQRSPSYPTELNGQPLTDAELSPGDIIQLDDAQMQLVRPEN